MNYSHKLIELGLIEVNRAVRSCSGKTDTAATKKEAECESDIKTPVKLTL